MIKINYISRIAIICGLFTALFSCDKDVSDVGGAVLTSTDIIKEELDDVASETENISLESIQANNFTGARLFGTSNNGVTGKVNYGLLYRVEPTESNSLVAAAGQTIKSIKIKSANLIIPYTYERLDSSNDLVSIYQITNVVNDSAALDFEVYRSNFKLMTTDFSINTPQLYFLDDFNSGSIEAGGSILKETLDVNPSSEAFEVTIAERNAQDVLDEFTNELISNAFEEKGKTLRVALNNNFLGETFTDSDNNVNDVSLFTTNSFLENFRGVYLKPGVDNANLVSLFDNSVTQIIPKIEITFEIVSDFAETEMEPAQIDSKSEVTLDFNMNQQVVTIVNSENSEDFNEAFEANETMVIKGGVSASRIRIFENESQLEALFLNNPVINSATLRLSVNTESPLYNQDNVPENLWINDLESGTLISGAALTRGDQPFYEFVITQHLRGVLNVDSVEDLPGLGLDFIVGISVEQIDTEITSQDQIPTPSAQSLRISSQKQQEINIGSLISTDEVPLYGSGVADQSKQPRLEIDFARVN